MEEQKTGISDRKPVEMNRRVTLERAIKAAAAMWMTGLGVPAAIYLWPMRRKGPDSGAIQAGPANTLLVGESKLLKVRGAPLLLVRESETRLHAFSAICTHLGCLVEWRKGTQDVFCPCHGGRFDLEGKVIGGPPPRPLPQYPVTIVDGEMQVNVNPS